MTADRRAALVKFGFDTGDYMCRCADCGLRFQGAKRSWRCRPCADEAVRGRAHTDDSANAPRTALVKKVADLVRFNHDPIAIANEAIDLIRAEVLEEAARVVTEHYQELCTEHRLLLVNRAAAIRALKEK